MSPGGTATSPASAARRSGRGRRFVGVRMAGFGPAASAARSYITNGIRSASRISFVPTFAR